MRTKDMLTVFETSVGAEAPASGTGETTSGDDQTPPAGAQNTDNESGGTPPETIPYSRFKEVNDAYRPYKELSDVGYDADSLRQLAEFETSFKVDPVSTWLAVAANIDGLPQEMKDMAQRHLDGS